MLWRIVVSLTIVEVHHSNERIYTRVGNASEPTCLIDRHTLDLLMARSAQYKTDFARLVSERPRVSESQETTTSFKALFFLDPWSQRQPSRALKLKEFAQFDEGRRS
jgi:hypothetical protein